MSLAVSDNPNACMRCQALCEHRTQVVLPETGKTGILCIGEAPGEDEDQAGVGFYGRAGKTLDRLMLEHGVQRHEFGRANIVRCRPPANRKPSRAEVDNCLPWLLDHIRQTKPCVILAVGGTATEIFRGKGKLMAHVFESRVNVMADTTRLKCEVATLLDAEQIPVVPMPHTSPLAWNRKAPNGVPWSSVGWTQAAIAVELSKWMQRVVA